MSKSQNFEYANLNGVHLLNPLEPSPSRKRINWISNGLEMLAVVVVSLVVSVFIRIFVAEVFWIPSGSMNDTLIRNDHIVVNKIGYSLQGAKRGDVVVFLDPGDWLSQETVSQLPSNYLVDFISFIGLYSSEGKNYLVKRVIGVGGDHVECAGRGEPVFLNGVPLAEPYVKKGELPSEIPFSVTVPKGFLWVMGDNRGHSADSRYHPNNKYGGFVPESYVVGKASWVFLPINRFGGIKDQSSTFLNQSFKNKSEVDKQTLAK